jgi:hypothetical protein
VVVALSRSEIEAMAPDQSALKAAAALLKPAKWSSRGLAGGLVWGECQGSGANPYRVAADTVDIGSKCTCPSRKFPCKHAIALMWLHADEPGGFPPGEPPDWVGEWMGRRRKSSGAAVPAAGATTAPKNLDAAVAEPAAAELDVAALEKRRVAAERRAADVRRQVVAGLDDLELWISDQLRTGLGGFLGEMPDRCRRIAARLVDAKAGSLSSRLDELPSRVLRLPPDERVDAAIVELGKLTLVSRAWRAAPDDPELRREVVATETRDDLLGDNGGLRHGAGERRRVEHHLVHRRHLGQLALGAELEHQQAADVARRASLVGEHAGGHVPYAAPADEDRDILLAIDRIGHRRGDDPALRRK